MPLMKCRYCGAHKGSTHHIRCKTRTNPTAYPADATVYVTTYTDTSGGGTSGGCDTSSTGSSDSGASGGDCG